MECRDNRDQPSDFCDLNTKPETIQSCSTGIPCLYDLDSSDSDFSGKKLFLPNTTNFILLLCNFPELIESEDEDQIYPLPDPEKLIGDQVVPSESTLVSKGPVCFN